MELEKLRKIIIRKILGEINEEELRLLNQWLTESEANRTLLHELTSEVFLRKAIGDNNRELCHREWEKLERLTVRKQAGILRFRWSKIAAAVLIPLLGGMAVWLLRMPAASKTSTEIAQEIRPGSFRAIVGLANGEQNFLRGDTIFDFENGGVKLQNRKDTLYLVNSHITDTSVDHFCVIRIPRGGEYIARLEDGTVIHLNADSELRVPVDFGIKERSVWLTGEAFFDVAPDKNRVFTVHTDKADISVLGTKFDIRAYRDERNVVTTLVEGSVQVNSGDAYDRLKPGYQVCVSEVGKISTREVDVYSYVAWKQGRMVFENERLQQIMTDLQRWYDFEISYMNPEIKDLRFTIDILKYDDIAKVLNLMGKMDKVTFSRKGRTLVLSGR